MEWPKKADLLINNYFCKYKYIFVDFMVEIEKIDCKLLKRQLKCTKVTLLDSFIQL